MKSERVDIDEGPIGHPCTLHGCVQILEMISTGVALTCSFLNLLWLTEAGGGFVVFVLISCLIFSSVFFVFHLIFDVTGLLKWQLAEWIGYICGVFLLVIALVVAIRGTTLLYIEEVEGSPRRLVENSPITVTAVFLVLAIIFYLIHAIQFSLLRLRNRSKPTKSESQSKSKKRDVQSNSSTH